ncbi:MAG: hypothetical protein AAGC79_15950, partial [Pseudomonadota bacterium]
MPRLIAALLFVLSLLAPAGGAAASEIEAVLETHTAIIQKGSRKTIQPAIDALAGSGSPEAEMILERWRAKELWARKADGKFFLAERIDSKTYRLLDLLTGAEIETVAKRDLKQIKPNSGVRALISAALVQFQLSAPDPAKRAEALDALERDADASHLPALRAAVETETDPDLLARKQRLERLLTVRFGETEAERITAIQGFDGDLGVDARAALNPLVATETAVAAEAPDAAEIARLLTPGEDLPRDEAYQLLVDAGLALPRIGRAAQREALIAQIDAGLIGATPVASLNTNEARDRAYAALAEAGLVPPSATETDVTNALSNHTFYERYNAAPIPVAIVANEILNSIERAVFVNQIIDLSLDALSLASIYFLAAIGLAITFGVMGVINMAHGEFIMMGAYTGYVVQLLIPDYTISILVALPAAFLVTFAAGVAMERLVIRWLYHRPLETLLATFGISIALQQIAKNIFGTQARPLTAPDWLSGAWQAAWTFVAWGVYQGALLALHRAFTGRHGRSGEGTRRSLGVWLIRLVSIAAFFQVVCYGWLLFRATSFAQITDFTARLVGLAEAPAGVSMPTPAFASLLGLGLLFVWDVLTEWSGNVRFYAGWPMVIRAALYAGMI